MHAGSAMRAGPGWAAGLAVAIGLALALGACAPLALGPTYPPIGVTPPPAGDATAATASQVVAALGAVGLPVVDAGRAYRPPEAPWFAASPRTVLQATLPTDKDHGYLVIYALGSPADALAAATEQATYVASGPGRIQFPTDARFTIRVVGATAIFFTWSPLNAIDPGAAAIATALATIGTPVAVPN